MAIVGWMSLNNQLNDIKFNLILEDSIKLRDIYKHSTFILAAQIRQLFNLAIALKKKKKLFPVGKYKL